MAWSLPGRPTRASHPRFSVRSAIPLVLLALVLAVGTQFGSADRWPAQAACGSFQALVNAAPAGGTITVPPCTYHEAVTVQKSLTINATGVIIDGDNVRDKGLAVLANDVTVNGLTVMRVKAESHVGAVWTTGISRFTFNNGVARDSSTVCISLNGGTGHHVSNSEFTGCGKEGYFMNGVSDTLFSGNRIHANNTAHGFDPAVEAGGGKTMASQRVTFSGNDVYSNGGPGIWFDVGAVDATVTNNKTHDNERAGIFFEISNGATISGNAVWNNGFGFVAWGYGAGITISSSDRAIVQNNTVAWNARGISVISQSRDLQPHNGNVVHDNVIVSSGGAFVTGFYDDHGGSLFDSSNGNSGYGNRYWVGAGEPSTDRFGWGGAKQRLGDYNGTPGEEGATYLTTSARDAALGAAGIPVIDGSPPAPNPVASPTRRRHRRRHHRRRPPPNQRPRRPQAVTDPDPQAGRIADPDAEADANPEAIADTDAQGNPEAVTHTDAEAWRLADTDTAWRRDVADTDAGPGSHADPRGLAGSTERAERRASPL